ncbi:hypothetical protein KIPB_013994, partial [Kipferlia bialata]
TSTETLMPSAILQSLSDCGRVQMLVAQTIVSLATLTNACRPWPVAERFGRRHQKERFGNGDVLRRAGLRVPPHKDSAIGDPRQTTGICQVAFIDTHLLPMLKEARRLFHREGAQEVVAVLDALTGGGA